MFGAFFGAVISLIVILAADDVSWWWLLWGSLIGLLFEVCIRVGCGEDVADAFCTSIDIGTSLGSIGDGGFDGGDSGGGDSGGGGGGGD